MPGDAKLSGRDKLVRFDEAEHLQPSLIFAGKSGNISVHGTIHFTPADTLNIDLAEKQASLFRKSSIDNCLKKFYMICASIRPSMPWRCLPFSRQPTLITF
jgi:hypothetical protein